MDGRARLVTPNNTLGQPSMESLFSLPAFAWTLNSVNSHSGAPLPSATAMLRVRQEFRAAGIYLNTASLGLPPERAWRALQVALDQWRAGQANPPDYDAPLAAARSGYANLVGVDTAQVAVGSQASVFAGLIAAQLPDDAEVLTATGEFTSIVFPFLAQAHRGVRVREVPLEDLADAITRRTALVAVSAVQSADGRLADLDALVAAAADCHTRVLLDTTQAVGWLPLDASRFAYTVCAGYKWLLAPRGTCYFTVQPDLADDLTPLAAGWYAGAQPWESIYGSPLRLASDARRFDLSPAWLAWVGAAPALELLTELGPETLHEHSVNLANRFRSAIGIPAAASAIVSLMAAPSAAMQLDRAHIAASNRAGRLRLAFHINNTADDVDRAADALTGHVMP